MKSIASFLLLSFIIRLRANRLLQQVEPEYCESDKDCVVKNVGNCCGFFPGCVNIDYIPDPDAVKKECEEKGLVSVCGWRVISRCSCNNNQCDEVYDPINLNPVAGDICGTQGNECAAIRAPSKTCPDGKTCYFNCGTCTYEDHGNGGLVCSNIVPRDRVCVPCCDPALKPFCIEGAACCGDGTWQCSIGDGVTFSCGNINTNPENFGPECAACSPLECRQDNQDCVLKGCLPPDPCNSVPSPCKADEQCVRTNFCDGCKVQCVPKVGCGIDNCIKYTDGCNECTCNADGTESCTEKACIETVVFVRKCLDCEFGYRLDENDKCVKKKECENSSDCDRPEFRCKPDPICRGKGRNNPNCTPRPRVCYANGGRCTSDADCDGNNGFKCIGMNNQGTGVCTKYQ